MLDQFTSADIDLFYASWKLGPRAKIKRLGTLRYFFRFCMNRKWQSENPVSTDIKPPIGANGFSSAPQQSVKPTIAEERVLVRYDQSFSKRTIVA